MTRNVLLLLSLVACDDLVLPDLSTDTLPPDATGWCAVDAILNQSCMSCHGDAGLGGLKLTPDAHQALVGVVSSADPTWTLVVPGSPETSLLLAKLTDPPSGGLMPPGEALSADRIELIRAWIADGASSECDDPIDPPDPNRHHPAGFAEPDAHGWSAKHQEEACVDCHGADLTGNGPAVSCDTCHPAGWRTDCTFCHGDPAEGSGAPPLHISGEDDGANATFIPHRAHTDDTAKHTAFACETCHAVPVDVLSAGHLFLGDTTPARAEATFTAGLSDAGRWNGNGQCSNLYCHGNGRGDNGTVAHTMNGTTCHSCHPDRTSGRDAWDGMSGEHEKHLREGLQCNECHGEVVSNSTTVATPALHVDGSVSFGFAGTITRTNGRCTGACHGEQHTNRAW